MVLHLATSLNPTVKNSGGWTYGDTGSQKQPAEPETATNNTPGPRRCLSLDDGLASPMSVEKEATQGPDSEQQAWGQVWWGGSWWGGRYWQAECWGSGWDWDSRTCTDSAGRGSNEQPNPRSPQKCSPKPSPKKPTSKSPQKALETEATTAEVRAMLQRPLTSLEEFERIEAEAQEFEKQFEMDMAVDLEICKQEQHAAKNEQADAKNEGQGATAPTTPASPELRSLDTQTTLPWTASPRPQSSELGDSQPMDVEAYQETQKPQQIPAQDQASAPAVPKPVEANKETQKPQQIPAQDLASAPAVPKPQANEDTQKLQQIPAQDLASAPAVPKPQANEDTQKLQQIPAQDLASAPAVPKPVEDNHTQKPQQVLASAPAVPKPVEANQDTQKPQQILASATAVPKPVEANQDTQKPQQILASAPAVPKPVESEQDTQKPQQIPAQDLTSAHQHAAAAAAAKQEQTAGPLQAIDKRPEEKWRRDKFGHLLKPAALYSRFYRNVRSIPEAYSVGCHYGDHLIILIICCMYLRQDHPGRNQAGSC